MVDFKSIEGDWVLDGAHSNIGFTVRHAGISKVNGKFAFVDGSVHVEGEGAVVKAVADAKSFDSGAEGRDEHIKSPEFLDVAQFPEVTFSGRVVGDELKGELTIHGVTREVTFDLDDFGTAVDAAGAERFGVEATTTISRKEFGLTWNVALDAGGVLVGDKVKLALDVSFVRA